jgi:hypothetical protein
LEKSKDPDGVLRPAIQHPISTHLRGLLVERSARGRSIWSLAGKHHDYHCVDTRDRVFAFLASTIKTSCPFRADYTKSNFQILLQLLEQEAHPPADVFARGDNLYLTNYLNAVGGFLLGPLAADIADMLRMRRLIPAAPNLPPLTQEQFSDSPTQLRVVLEVQLGCIVLADGNGNMMASLSTGDEAPMPVGDHDFRHVEQSTGVTTVKVRTPMGMVSALVSRNVKASDSILILREASHWRRAPITGLVVRLFDCGIHTIVGQVVFGDEFSSASIYDLLFSIYHFRRNWVVFMSPADFILFVAQDLKSYISPPEEGVGPTVVLSICPEEKAKRLTTSVTSDLVSSFATRTPNWLQLPW